MNTVTETMKKKRKGTNNYLERLIQKYYYTGHSTYNIKQGGNTNRSIDYTTKMS